MKALGNYAFIDSQNLNLGLKNDLYDKKRNKYYEGWNLDFKKFRTYLTDKYFVGKAYLFIGYLAGNEALYTSLQQFGYILIFKPTLEIFKDGKMTVKGNVDAELVLHSMIEYPNYKEPRTATSFCAGSFERTVFRLRRKATIYALPRSIATL